MELRATDGSPKGTTILSDIMEGVSSSNPSETTVSGNLIFFGADDFTNGEEFRTVPVSAPAAFRTEMERSEHLLTYPEGKPAGLFSNEGNTCV